MHDSSGRNRFEDKITQRFKLATLWASQKTRGDVGSRARPAFAAPLPVAGDLETSADDLVLWLHQAADEAARCPRQVHPGDLRIFFLGRTFGIGQPNY